MWADVIYNKKRGEWDFEIEELTELGLLYFLKVRKYH